jgi:hypothetical protein
MVYIYSAPNRLATFGQVRASDHLCKVNGAYAEDRVALVSNSGIYLHIAIEHPQDHNHDCQLLRR